MTRVRLIPYGPSTTARLLSEGTGITRCRSDLVRTRFRPRPGDVLLNWGTGSKKIPHGWYGDGIQWLNSPTRVDRAVNKLSTFNDLAAAGVPIPEWTDDPAVAHGWISSERPSSEVAGFARTVLTGHAGVGIVPFYHATEYGPEGNEWPRAPLYTKGFNAEREYRVHVVGAHTYLVQKRKRNGCPSHPIRNHGNGYVFCVEKVDECQQARDVAVDAVTALGLDYAGVDVLAKRNGDVAVLEVNTAPGLEGSALTQLWLPRLRELLEQRA